MIIYRKGALGDIILLTPVLREYKLRNPNSFLGVSTFYPDVFFNSPYVDSSALNLSKQNEPLIDLNGEYEKNLNQHPIDSYALRILGDTNLSYKKLDLFPLEQDREIVDNWWNKTIKDGPVAVVHWGITWVQMVANEIEAVMTSLKDKFTHIILVGRKIPGKEYYPKTREKVIDLVDAELSIHRMHWLINKSNIFIGTDTGVMHIASTTNTPIVCCYSFVNPENRKPFRPGIAFEPVVGRENSCQMMFCAESRKIMCPNGDFGGVNCLNNYACSKNITAEMIIEKIQKVMV